MPSKKLISHFPQRGQIHVFGLVVLLAKPMRLFLDLGLGYLSFISSDFHVLNFHSMHHMRKYENGPKNSVLKMPQKCADKPHWLSKTLNRVVNYY